MKALLPNRIGEGCRFQYKDCEACSDHPDPQISLIYLQRLLLQPAICEAYLVPSGSEYAISAQPESLQDVNTGRPYYLVPSAWFLPRDVHRENKLLFDLS